MRTEFKTALKRFAFELILYAALVAGYYLAVLHFLGTGLEQLYQHNRRTYAAMALGLIVMQGLLLEILTRLLIEWMTPRRRKQ